jgi:hypothetical protein
MTDKISEVFDITPIPPSPLPPVIAESNTVHEDAEQARNNLRRLAKTADQALELALDMARNSDSPRAYEVLATLLTTAADLNTRVVDTHQKEQKITPPTPETPATVTNNSIVFTGTTAELSDLIKKKLGANNETIAN